MGFDGDDNERLEFLGDSVLDLIIAEILYDDSELTESDMTELRKSYVSNEQLAVIFDSIDMEPFIRTANNFRLTSKVKAGFVEALIGAIYLELGHAVCVRTWNVIQKILSNIGIVGSEYKSQWDQWAPEPYKSQLRNAKTTLQEFCQAQQFELPEYKVIKKSGPEHNPYYTVKLIIRPGLNKLGFENVFDTYVIDKPYVRSIGKGKNVKLAEMRAAEQMCDRIGLMFSSKDYY